jgi:hypothetical protein
MGDRKPASIDSGPKTRVFFMEVRLIIQDRTVDCMSGCLPTQ